VQHLSAPDSAALVDVAPGERVVVVARAGRAAARALFAVIDAGAVCVPANPSYLHDELVHVVNDAGARQLIDVDGDRAIVDAVAETTGVTVRRDVTTVAPTGPLKDDRLAMLIYTSGTTGRAKGCAHTLAGLKAGLAPLMAVWGIGPGDVVINALPLFHVHGGCVALMGPLWAGADVMLLDRFSPADVVSAARAGGTVLMCVPTMVHRLTAHLVEHERDRAAIAALRLVTCGSAPLSPAQLEAFRAVSGQTIVERYGMSETLITLSNTLERRVPGAVGWPLPGTETRVVDDELWVRGPGVMRGYFDRPDADAQTLVAADDAGGRPWLKTGDAVTVDDDGCVRIVGRLSQDILKVGGFKLSAREIEDACASHPAIAEVAVVGAPDDEWGERVCAVVVVRAGQTLTLPALQAHVQLAPVKLPRQLVLTDALPRTALGKVQKQALKALASAAGAAT